MLGLGRHDRVQARDIAAMLVARTQEPTFGLSQATEALTGLLRARGCTLFGLRRRGQGVAVDYSCQAGLDGRPVISMLDTWLKDRPVGWSIYNPLCPEPNQRNKVLAFSRTVAAPIAREFYPKAGLDGDETLRVLLCDGPIMLGYLGFLRPDPFSARELFLLDQLKTAFARRLRLERLLNNAPLIDAALTITMEHISSPAFVLGPHGVAHANEAGRAALDASGQALLEELRIATLSPAGARYLVTPIEVPGFAGHSLVIRIAPPEDFEPRLTLVARRCALTPRQVQVLRLVASGSTNKDIAARLGCVEGTIELHVTALLTKMHCHSRSQLTARTWTTR
jgi:DNA-binding CsgD family transcriptional regulator